MDYTFLSKEEFLALEKSGDLLESGVYEGKIMSTNLGQCGSSTIYIVGWISKHNLYHIDKNGPSTKILFVLYQLKNTEEIRTESFSVWSLPCLVIKVSLQLYSSVGLISRTNYGRIILIIHIFLVFFLFYHWQWEFALDA